MDDRLREYVSDLKVACGAGGALALRPQPRQEAPRPARVDRVPPHRRRLRGRAPAPSHAPPLVRLDLRGGAVEPEAEYPLPGSTASCDACGEVVNRYYHCQDCQEATGLFDLCVRCCGAIYLKSHGGPPLKIDHPTHDYDTHRMAHVCPPAGR